MKPGVILFFCADLHFGDRISFVWCSWVLAMPQSRSPLRLLAGGKPVAFTIHLQDVDMMGEPVEQSTGKPFRTEYGCPFIEWQVAGDESGATFIALAEHLEEQFGDRPV